MKFHESPEGQEYISKIQAGNVKPQDPSFLEGEALSNLHDRQSKLQALTARRSDMERQLAEGRKQVEAVGREIDLATGELRAFAQVLLFAEGARRNAKRARRDATEAQKPGEDPTGGNDNADRVAKQGRTGKNTSGSKAKRTPASKHGSADGPN